jgi:hypothetical protein
MSNSHSDFFIKNDLEACEKVNNIYGHACRPPIMCTNPVAGLCMDYESVQRDMQRRPAEMQHIKRRSKAWSSGSSGPLSQTRPKIPVIDEHGRFLMAWFDWRGRMLLKRPMTLPQDGRLPDWSGFMPAVVLSFAANS